MFLSSKSFSVKAENKNTPTRQLGRQHQRLIFQDKPQKKIFTITNEWKFSPYVYIFLTLENFSGAAEDIDGEIDEEDKVEGESEAEYEKVAVEELLPFFRQTWLSENSRSKY